MEKELNREVIYDGKIMQVTREEVELEDGNHAFREVVYHHGGVCVLAVENHQILLVKQFRYPNRVNTLEIPAGKLEKDEDTKECAFRELEEETNCRAQDMKFIMKVLPSPGYTSEWLYLYEAVDSVSYTHLDVYKRQVHLLKSLQIVLKINELLLFVNHHTQ